MGGECSTYGDTRGAYRVFLVKCERMRPFERPRHRWEDNIKVDLQEVGCGVVDWNDLARDRDSWWNLCML